MISVLKMYRKFVMIGGEARILTKGDVRMLKVFLVEDEYVVREGIKNNIAWKEHGFDFCGEASDGELAYTQIRKLKPDIIITDIKMPFMNGLELSRLVKKDLPEVKIIILSGYGDFEFAKEAINIGIEEYLLKPINAQDLLDTVQRVSKKIMTEKEERENMMKFRKEMSENEIQNKRNFFHELMDNSQSLPYILDKGREFGIDLNAGYYNIILFKASRVKHQEENFSNTLVQAYDELTSYFDSQNILWFDRNLEGFALLIMAETVKEMEELQATYISQIEQIIRKYNKITYFGGVGCYVNRLSELYLSFEEANRAFAYRFIKDENQFLEAGAIREIRQQEDNPWASLTDTEYLDKEIAEKFLRSGELGEVSYFVEEYLKNFNQAAKDSLMFRQYIVMDMYFITANFIEKLNYKESGFKLDNPFQSAQHMNEIVDDYDHTLKFITALFTKAISCRNEAATKKFTNIIEEVKEYIHKNYQNEELSLNQVASVVNISPSYLSTVFSQETGQTFVKYLTDLRMNKAMELLMCTNKRSSEIGMEVGYKDPHYFSYLFKKTQGCTPLQYRMNKSKSGEDQEDAKERY